jgi:ABC-type Fe3+/spermidine/putrescine transport system ATPase subunit
MAGGFVRPDAGRVLLDDRDVTHDPPNRRATAMVFQSYALFPHLTVADNVGYALRVRGRPRSEITARVRKLLQLVRLEGLGERRPDQLSGGQQQRVALARSLSVQPRVLLLDEPLSNLDANLRVLMRDEIKRLQQELGLTVVYVTHDQEEAMSISDRIAVMRAGRVEQIGAPVEIYERPATQFVASFVGAAMFLDGVVGGRDVAGLVVRTPLGLLVVRDAPAGLAVDSAVRLVLRPEAVRLTAGDPAAGATGRPGKIIGAVYTGAVVRYAVEVGGVRLTVDLHDPRHGPRFADGDRVTVDLPADPQVLPATPDGM